MNFLKENRVIINTILPIFIMLGIFYSGNLGQRVSEIDTNYIIDTNTLNNTWIALDIFASEKNLELYKQTKNNLNDQMKTFNERYGILEKEKLDIKNKKDWVDAIIYILIVLQFLYNSVILNKLELS